MTQVLGRRPVSEKHLISCEFGRKGKHWRGGVHKGVDFACPVGTPVEAYRKGKVVFAGNTGDGFGNYVKLEHDGFFSYCCHLDQIFVGVGDKIEEGHPMASSGDSGNSTAPHLHFETRVSGKAVEPLFYV